MKIFAAVIFLAAGLLLTTASGPAQTELNCVSSTISTHGNSSRNQPRVFKISLGNATTGSASFVNINIPGLVLSGGDTSGSGLAKQRVVESYGKMPLSFEANMGQTDSRVQFLSRGPGYTLFLTSGEAVLVSGKGKRPDVARMKLTGCNPAPEVRGLDELSGKSYYFIGDDPKKWQSKVPNYARVRYQGVYPGIDLVYYGDQRQLEYDFVVAPGADPKPIQLSFPEAREIRTDRESGDLMLDCAAGEVRFHKPLAYQMGDGKTFVEARYVLNKEKQVSIAIGSYDVAKPLIIDPVLSYSTYLGGSNSELVSNSELGSGIAVDASGNAYVTGNTSSPNFPIVHPLPTPDNALQGPEDAFVCKLSFNSTTGMLSLAYSAYLGGGGFDEGRGIAVDASGNAYLTGVTSSPNFPIVHPLPAPNNALQGPEDAFVSKLSFDSATSTLSLTYSTYLGGIFRMGSPRSGGTDEGHAIAVDASGNAYVTGVTGSAGFPTVNPLIGGIQSERNAFVSKLSFDNPTSTLSLAYSTYLGGGGGGFEGGFDEGNGIAVDASGNAYVTGTTTSPDFPIVHPLPAPNDALQGGEDAFVSKLRFDSATSTLSLVYSTYLGGSVNDFSLADFGRGIAVDASGNAYVTGDTSSPNFPMVHPLPAPNNILQGPEDAFVSKLSFDSATSTLSLVYSTYLGGSNSELGSGIAVDASGNAYVTGNTSSPNFPMVHPLPAPNNALQGPEDAFVSKLSFNSTTGMLSLAYSAYLGGGGFDEGRGIAVDTSGNAYLTGVTSSPNFPIVHPLPAPNNALQGNGDAFVAKLASPCTKPPTITGVSVIPAVLWPPNHKIINATVTYNVTAECGGTTTSSLSVASNEPVNGTGDGNTSPDWVVLGPHNVELRAERAGTGIGRIYTITISSRDTLGNAASQTVTVTVPHDKGH